MHIHEVNFDGLVGPTHHYAGLAVGNLASMHHALNMANPKAAAHQGLNKMRLLHHASLPQALLPPHQRPNLQLLRQLGFSGTPAQQIEKAYRNAPELLHACYSAASMWAANTATVSPSLDTNDHRVHITAANLVSNLHRHQEARFSKKLLQHLFNDEAHFYHHELIPSCTVTSDEGAANTSRMCKNHSSPGIYLFAYSKQQNKQPQTQYPARQALEASQAIARAHQLNPDQVLFACQNPRVIDEGVFHNDVIALANESVFLLHQEAFLQQSELLNALQNKADFDVNIIEVSRDQVTVSEAVSTYLFNSQLVTIPGSMGKKRMMLIAPSECKEHPRVKLFIDELLADSNNPIVQAHYVDLKQSMLNGGGPACLRLRVPLTAEELGAMHQGVLVNDELLDTLTRWIDRHYRSQLHVNDLRDPLLMDECFSALDELTALLKLGSIYPFQQP